MERREGDGPPPARTGAGTRAPAWTAAPRNRPHRLQAHPRRRAGPPDPFAEPQRAGLALPDSGPTPQPTQRIADHDGTDGAWNVEKVMGHRQRGQAPGHGRRLEPPRLAIVNIGDKPRFVGGQADPAALGREARVAIEIDRERLDAGGRPRLDALLGVEFDQSGALDRKSKRLDSTH